MSSLIQRSLSGTALTWFAIASLTTPAHAQAATPANLDGSQGLSGWHSVGDVAVRQTAVGNLPWPTGVSAFTLGTATHWDEDDAGVAPGSFNLSGTHSPAYDTDLVQVSSALGVGLPHLGADAYEGSALARQLTVNAGTTVSFQWRAWSHTPAAALGSQDDAIWFTASGAGQQAAGAPLATLSSLFSAGSPVTHGVTGGWLDSGWHTVGFTVAQAGTLSLAWGVVDHGSTTDTTVLAMRDLSVTPGVPEPQSLALALAGLLSVVVLRRRPG